MHITPLMIRDSATYLQNVGTKQPEVGIVLGTGLGQLLTYIQNPLVIAYDTIPHFPLSTVEFHKGNLVYGNIGNTSVLAMQGRFHFYEGYNMQQVTFPVRVMKELGIKNLLLSNAAGGLNPSFKKGDLVVINDHINLLPDNPLRGLNDPSFGERFVDMSCPYDKMLANSIIKHAGDIQLEMKTGVYVAVPGPNLETRAEYRWLRSMGADLVGMSTVPEVIVANQLNLPCVAISVITDECDPDHLEKVNISEIIAVAHASDKKLAELLALVIKKLNED